MNKMSRRRFASLLAATALPSLLPLPAASNTMKHLIKPPRLKQGDVIGLIAPSGHTSDAAIQKSVEHIEALGFKVKPGRYLREVFGNYAGDNFASDNCNSPGTGLPCAESKLSGDVTYNSGNRLTNVSDIQKIWDFNPSIGGPIVQNKIWFNYSFRHWGVPLGGGDAAPAHAFRSATVVKFATSWSTGWSLH